MEKNDLVKSILPFEMPTKEDFDWMDLNEDNCLTMEEWKKTVSKELNCKFGDDTSVKN